MKMRQMKWNGDEQICTHRSEMKFSVSTEIQIFTSCITMPDTKGNWKRTKKQNDTIKKRCYEHTIFNAKINANVKRIEQEAFAQHITEICEYEIAIIMFFGRRTYQIHLTKKSISFRLYDYFAYFFCFVFNNFVVSSVSHVLSFEIPSFGWSSWELTLSFFVEQKIYLKFESSVHWQVPPEHPRHAHKRVTFLRQLRRQNIFFFCSVPSSHVTFAWNHNAFRHCV